MLHLFWLGFALAASPGPDFFLMVRHTLAQGRRIGYLTLAGNRLSLCIHMCFAIFGLSLILERSAVIFTIIRSLGALYLVYLGIKNLWEGYKSAKSQTRVEHPAPVQEETEQIGALQAFQRGFLNNLLNPKVSLFFLSLFPQFTTPDQLSAEPLRVAILFFVGNSSWYLPILFVIGFAVVRQWVKRFQKMLAALFGFVFLFYGGKILWDELPR